MTQIIPVILAGGVGSRLASVLYELPKPLAPVSGRPFITYLLDRLLAAGFERAIIATGHLGEKFPEILGNSYHSLKLTYSQESEPLGTGGAIRLAMELVSDESQQFLVMNGDSFVDIKVADFISWAYDYSESMVLVQVSDCSRYGSVVIDEMSRVLEFREKAANSFEGWINAGIYLLSREFVMACPAEKNFSLEHTSLPELVASCKLFGFSVLSEFIDIGVPETFLSAGDFLKKILGSTTVLEV